jgi:hypothetical protein
VKRLKEKKLHKIAEQGDEKYKKELKRHRRENYYLPQHICNIKKRKE